MEEAKSRFGKKWLLDEDEELIKEIEDKKNYEEIALNHKRTINGIILRVIDKIIYNEYKNDNKSIDDLSVIYNIDKFLIEKQITKLEINNSIKKNREIENKNKTKDKPKNKDIENIINHIKLIEKRLENIENKLELIINNIQNNLNL